MDHLACFLPATLVLGHLHGVDVTGDPATDGSHLKLGVQPQGLLMLLEEIGFIYWDGESSGGGSSDKTNKKGPKWGHKWTDAEDLVLRDAVKR